jgi:hypothetical protein
MTSPISPEIQISVRVFNAIKQVAQKNRDEALLAKLEENGISIQEAKLKSAGYLSSLIRTIEAVERASTIEKINILMNLFITSDSRGFIEQQPDFYQEILSIFSELSYRELMILYHLDKGGLPYTDDLHVKSPELAVDNEDMPNPLEQYEEANAYCAKGIKVNQDVLGALLGRLARTGLIGNAPEWTSLVFFFTPLYRDLKRFFSYEFYGA